MQPYPRSPDLVWPGHLHGTGCLSARAVGTGFPTIVRRLCFGPVCGWVWVLLTPPSWLGSGVGVFGHRFRCCPSSVGCLWCLWLGFGFGLLYGSCVVSCAPRLPPAVSGSGVRCGVRAGPGSPLCPALLGWVVGVCFFLRFCCFFFLPGVPVPGLVVPVPPSPFFRTGLLAPFFFRGVCLHVSVSLFPLGRCSWLGVAGFGWVVPLCLFGGPVFGAFWGGGLAASRGVGGQFGGCGLFSRPPPSPLCCFFWGGGAACFSLCFPWAGARTGPYSVLSSGLLSAVAFCLAVFRPHGSGGLCTRWARRPFLPG